MDLKNASRDHDKISYLSDSKLKRFSRSEPLEIFKFSAELLDDIKKPIPGKLPKLLDIGCAAGEFLYWLEKTDLQLFGMDPIPELIQAASDKLTQKCILTVGSATDHNAHQKDTYDYITMINVHMVFDDLHQVIENIYKWLKPGGRFILTGAFSPNRYTLLSRYIDTTNTEGLKFGWNLHSLPGTIKIFTETGFTNVSSARFQMPFPVIQRPDDDLSQFTQEFDDGRQELFNGLSMHVQNYRLCGDKHK